MRHHTLRQVSSSLAGLSAICPNLCFLLWESCVPLLPPEPVVAGRDDYSLHHCRRHSPRAASSAACPHLPVPCSPTSHRRPSCLCQVASSACQVRGAALRASLRVQLFSTQFFSCLFRWLVPSRFLIFL